MTITFFSNFLNHHQLPFCLELMKLVGEDNFRFVACEPIHKERSQMGYEDMNSKYPFVVCAYESVENSNEAYQLAELSDVVIIGAASDVYVLHRIEVGKLTFRYHERWFKSKPWFFSGPRAWIDFYKHHIRFKNKPLYMLAASAYTANDVYAVGAYKGKVYKWGYFTAVPDRKEVQPSELNISASEIIPHIMWCGRFLKWKHPELPVRLAARLKDDGYKFVLNMYGSGEELESTKALTHDLCVEDVVSFCGNFSNQEILAAMRRHQIFLFTSDKNEGWGAVLNESMSSGCAVVASNRIGATPFLIEDGHNGLVFKSENIDSLYVKVKSLLDDEGLRKYLSHNAYNTMSEIWNPKNAAQRFIQLVLALKNGDDTPFMNGPCSKAFPCKY